MAGSPPPEEIKTELHSRLDAVTQHDLIDGIPPYIRDKGVSPSMVSQFFNVQQCPQFFKYEFDSDVQKEERASHDYREAFMRLKPLLAKDGEEFESDIYEEIETGVGEQIQEFDSDSTEDNHRELLTAITNTIAESDDTPTVLAQATLNGVIGVWPISGDADLIYMWWDGETLTIRVADVKAAMDEKTYHQMQIAIYTRLLRNLFTAIDLDEFVDYTLEGGVIHRESGIITTSDSGPMFDVSSRETDIRRLMKADGMFDRLAETDNDDILYQLGDKCGSCRFREACYTNSVEQHDLSLLEISTTQQETLHENGINTIEDLSELGFSEDSNKPYEYYTFTENHSNPSKSNLVKTLTTDSNIGSQLPTLIQKAQALIAEYAPGTSHAASENPSWLVGSGDGSLPEDNPPEFLTLPGDDGYTLPESSDGEKQDPLRPPRNELIRIYLHVQEDHRREDVVMLSGYITATKYGRNNDPITFSELVDDIQDDRESQKTYERDMLEYAVKHISDGVNEIADALGHDDRTHMHLYFYSSQEYDLLRKSLAEHSDSEKLSAFADLLELSGNIHQGEMDQPMTSIIQSEIQNRIAPQTPNTGLLPIHDQLYSAGQTDVLYNWKYTRDDGRELDARSVFGHRFFNYSVPYYDHGDYHELLPGSDAPPYGSEDGYYPVRFRSGAQIPLEYIWSAVGKLTREWLTDSGSDSEIPFMYEQFLFHDAHTDGELEPIVEEDVENLGELLANAVASVERSLRYRNIWMEKPPIQRDAFNNFSLGSESLERACREFLDLEYESQREETKQMFAKPVLQRIRTGESIAVIVEEVDEGENFITVKGKVFYDFPEFDDPDQIANACRLDGDGKDTSGDWMVASPLDNETGNPINWKTSSDSARFGPDEVERGVPVTINKLDIADRDIKFSHMTIPTPSKDYVAPHRHGVVDERTDDDWAESFERGKAYILDPQTDDITSQKALEMLSNTHNHPTYQLLTDIINGDVSNPTADSFDGVGTCNYLEWLKNNEEWLLNWGDEEDFPPNEKQTDFIQNTDAKVSLLQGPPGTGKTSGALSKALIARLNDYEQQSKSLTGIVSGTSHKSVKELLEDTNDAYGRYIDHPETDALEDVELFRIVGNPENADPDNRNEHVTYVNVHEEDENVLVLFQRLLANESGEGSIRSGETGSPRHTLVFATPGGLHALMKKIAREVVNEDSPQAEDLLEYRKRYFDLVAVDEASMQSVPSFLMVTAFIRRTGQILVSGDQRQMPPIVQHEWSEEKRRTVAKHAPYLSALDFHRYLAGHNVDAINEDLAFTQPDAGIPQTQLEETYRCHTVIAEFLNKYLYQKDGINYRSNRHHTIDTPDGATDGIDAVLDPDTPLVVVKHNETSSQQTNIVEAAMTKAVAEGLPDAQKNEYGVVVPHNAQKGFLNSILPTEKPEDNPADTVERFQGDQEDVIMLSATASDPEFLESEDEFILNKNRLNVAMSRPKKLLVVFVSESIPSMVPSDVDTYEEAVLWKGLFEEIDALDSDAMWSGSLMDFLGDADPGYNYPENPDVEVYGLNSLTE